MLVQDGLLQGLTLGFFGGLSNRVIRKCFVRQVHHILCGKLT